MADPARIAEGLSRVRIATEAFAAELESLDASDWYRPTICEPWNVKTLAAHLVRGAESYTTGIERGLAGIREPHSSREERARRIREIAEQPPEQVIAQLRAASNRFDALVSGLGPAEQDTLGPHAWGLRPVIWFVELRLSELAFHRWDLRVSLGRGRDFDEDTARWLMPLLLESNLPVIFRAEATEPFAIALRVQPSTPPGWLLASDGQALTVTRADDGPAQLVGDSAALALLLYGRERLADLEQAGRVTCIGDRVQIDRLLRGLGTP